MNYKLKWLLRLIYNLRIPASLFFVCGALNGIGQTPSFPYKFPDRIEKEFPNCKDSSTCDQKAKEYSFIGEFQLCLKFWNQDNTEANDLISGPAENLVNITAVPALEYIKKNIGDHQVIMINEAHHIPYHRIFTAELLPLLYKKGFRYLGLEALYHHPKYFPVNDPDFLTTRGGFYLKDPQFGNLIRYARQIGFSVFSYESPGHSGEEREIDQAQNIYEILKKDHQAKILVHTGWGHVSEDEELKAMAYHFKKISSIDPFTISQCSFNEQSDTSYENMFYKKHAPKDYPVTFLMQNKENVFKSNRLDMLIMHPRTTFPDDRPSYLSKNKRYKKVIVKNSFKSSQPYFVMAYLKDELEKNVLAIPVDIVYCKNSDREKLNFYLPFKGKYLIYYYNPEQTKSVEVMVR